MTTSTTGSSRHLLFMKIVLLSLLVLSFVAANDEDQVDATSRLLKRGGGNKNQLPGTIQIKEHKIIRNDAADEVCYTICDARRQIVAKRYGGGDLSNRTHVREIVNQASQEMVDKMKKDYGDENFKNIFEAGDSNKNPLWNRTYRGFNSAKQDDSSSVERMKRKLLLKILNVQLAFENQDLFTNIDGCDCSYGKHKATNANAAVPKNVQDATEFQILPNAIDGTQFVWATGGHSAAAGHGNLYNESYTVFLENAVGPLFSSIGIEFVGRNYAMGGTGSAPEVSLCTRSIFGDDIDMISWDYGMTDGKDFPKIFFYGYRAALHNSRPGIIGIHINGRQQVQRLQMFQTLQNLGSIPAFSTVESEWDAMLSAVPDSANGMTQDDLDHMPPMIKNFKCDNNIEKGSPNCGKEKFNLALCPTRKAKTSWHPGFKHQAMDGNRMALFLMQLVNEAVNDPRYVNAKNLRTLRNKLQAEEDAEYDAFLKKPLPDPAAKMVGDAAVREIIFRKPSVCHTGRLPAQIRYKGVLTNQVVAAAEIAGPELPGKEKYVTGTSKEQTLKEASDKNTPGSLKSPKPIRLIYENGEREWNCPVKVKADYMDYFMSPYEDGWTRITVPNEAERIEYGFNDDNVVVGLIIICPPTCSWGRCPKGDIGYKSIFPENNNDATATDDATPAASFRVNGNNVPGWTNVIGGCYALHSNTQGDYYHTPNSNGGAFDIDVKANEPGTYLRMSSIVVY